MQITRDNNYVIRCPRCEEYYLLNNICFGLRIQLFLGVKRKNEAISSVDNQHWNVCHPWTYMIVDSRFVFLADLTAINSALR